MANVVTIETKNGQVTINSELLTGYIQEAFEHLTVKSEAEAMFKEVVETVAETTSLPKGVVSKYFKARFEEKTKDTKELGELFGKLDEAVAV